jgi:hypothetical protein
VVFYVLSFSVKKHPDRDLQMILGKQTLLQKKYNIQTKKLQFNAP